MKLLSQQEAAAVDQDLMEAPGFSIDQLMELAGLSVAAAVRDAFPPSTHKRVLCVCGPGNNGGDGLVAARHLVQFGYEATVVYPKRPNKPLFVNLAAQMEMMRIPLLDALPASDALSASHDVVLDAIFGFSFAGDVRAPFDTILPALRASSLPLVSVDIPSGWHVEDGPPAAGALEPQVLVSLTAPKMCAAHFRGGRHYLGGRFVPPPIAEKYGVQQPPFEGADQVVRLA
jgi:NAD(P)H-hydrate epimerase